MRQAPIHRVVDSACSRVGRASQRAGTFLSVLCLFFISVFTASIPASFEERIGYFFLFGLIPALGFYLIGYILRGMLALSCKLCGIIAPHCLRWQARFTNSLLNWASASVLDLLDRCSLTLAHCRLATGQWMQILFRLDQKERRSLNRQYRYVRGVIIEFSCLLIRNSAQFVITVQQSVERPTTRASCLSFNDMTLLISNNMQCKQPPSARRPQPAPLDRWLNRQQRTGPLQGHFCRVGVDLSPPHGFVAGAVRRAEAPAQRRGELVAHTFGRGHGVGRSQSW
jgi:hypothetical protein